MLALFGTCLGVNSSSQDQARATKSAGNSNNQTTQSSGLVGRSAPDDALRSNRLDVFCKLYTPSEYTFQLSSTKSLENALIFRDEIAANLSGYNIPGEAFIVYKPPHYVVMAGDFPRSPSHEELANAKTILNQGGFTRYMDDFCANGLRAESRDYCLCLD
ncbi:hypothetical protein ACNOYE_39140 [Nannocystaceae bacterium ST9]